MSYTILAAPVADFLDTLGWRADPACDRPVPGCAAVTSANVNFPGLRVERATRGDARTNAYVFVLTPTKETLRRLIPRVVVDGYRPRYQQKVHAWFQAATLKLADLQREEEEHAARVRREQREGDDVMRSVVGDDADLAEIRRMATFTFINHNGVRTLSHVSRQWYIANPFVFPPDLPDTEKLAKLGRLVGFLKSEGMLPSQYPKGNHD